MVSSLFHIWDHSHRHTDRQTHGHKTDNAGQRPRDSGGYPPYGKPENPPEKLLQVDSFVLLHILSRASVF